jgi:hypothetical protein
MVSVFGPGVLVGHTGLMRSGKTMNATRLGYKVARAGFPVWANYGLSFPYRPIRSMDDLIAANGPGMIIIDEAHLILDSRQFSRSTSIDLSHFITLVGKRRLCLHYVTQSVDLVDKRLRELTSVFFHCQKISPSHAQVTRYDGIGGGEFISGPSFNLVYNRYYHLYDTLEMVESFLNSDKKNPISGGKSPQPVGRGGTGDGVIIRKKR